MVDETPNAPAPVESPAPAAIVPTPEALVIKPPEKSAVQVATEAARARVAEGKPAVPEDVGEQATIKKPTPRDETGQFTDQPRKKLREPVETKAEPTGAPVPDDGPAATADEPAPGEGEGAPAERKPADGQPAAKPGEEPAAADEPGEEGLDDLIEVEVPTRREGITMKIPVATQEEADTLKMLTNSFTRRQALEGERANVQEMERDYNELKEIMEADPAGFALDAFAESPETAERVALTLLSDPRVWEKVKDRIIRWEDPDVLDAERTKIENQNLKAKATLRDSIEEQRAVSKNLREVQTTVAAIIPPDMAEDEQAIFFRDALRDLKEFADRNNRITLDVTDIPLILAQAGRLKAHKIDAIQASERIVEARSNRRPQNDGSKRPAASAPAPSRPAAPAPPQKTGKELVERSRQKRAAASTPAGGGSPSSSVTPPPNQTIAERLKWHRDQKVKGRTLTR